VQKLLIASGCNNNSISRTTGFNGVMKQYTFDIYKRPSTEKQTINGVDYTTSFTYTNYGQISKITYPSGLDIFTNYDVNGYLLSKNYISNLPKTQLFRNGIIDGEGKYTSYILGNNITTNKTYSNDFLTANNTPGIQNLYYNFDAATSRLMQRTDNNKTQFENFSYDNLNRLTGFNVNNNQYRASTLFDGDNGNSIGNIAAKTDAGYYKYKTDKIHAVAYTMEQPVPGQSAVFPPPISAIPQVQQLITYTPFLKAQSITEDNYQLNFTYGPDYERVKTELLFNGNAQETRYFLGDYEIQIKNGITREIHYVSGGEGLCAILVKENGVTTPYVIYTDHLGSIVSVTDTKGNIIAEQNFDAWGRRRPANKWYTYYPAGAGNMVSLPDWLYRGYTGHEMLPQFNLINMNGRIYDPILGRMLSPDNYVSTPYGTQGYNRYAYGMNNPLTYTDPDGNFPWAAVIIGAAIGGFSKAVQYDMSGKSFFGGFWRGAIVGAAGGYAAAMAPIGILPGAGFGAGVGAVLGAANALLDGNNVWRSTIKGAIFGGIAGGITGGVEANKLGANVWTGQRPDHYLLVSECIPNGTGGSAPYTEDYLNKLYNQNYAGTPGVSWMTTKMPKGTEVLPDGSWIVKDKRVLAATQFRSWANGNSSRMMFSQAAFASKERLAFCMAHELGHVTHIYLGLTKYAYQETSNVGNDPLLDTEGHLAIQNMTNQLVYKNGWDIYTLKLPQAEGNSILTASPSLLNPLSFLIKKIVFPR
jgi:RHS repeat-associated protein